MCNFFSAISDGKGKVLFFKIEDIVIEMSKGNPQKYDWNSHTSIAYFHGIKGADEDKWNKWEYDVDKKELKSDQLNTVNDKLKVKKQIEEFFNDKDIVYIRNIYNYNSGNRNSGNRNSGYGNSGNCNSGNRNSGNCNSGYWNSGNCNSGNGNSGNCNSGYWNSGYWNSGNRNSGNWNSGNRNSGYLNTNDPDKIRIFNQWFDNIKNIQWPNFFYFDLTQWVSHDTATEQEKKDHKTEIETCGGFLKKLDYKEAWKLSYKKASKKDRALVKKIPGFNKDLFFEITGIKI